MSQKTPFQIRGAQMEASCLPTTKTFLGQNLHFLDQILSELRMNLSGDGRLTAVSFEETYSFGVKIDRSELGVVSEANGILIEGTESCFDEALNELNSPSH